MKDVGHGRNFLSHIIPAPSCHSLYFLLAMKEQLWLMILPSRCCPQTLGPKSLWTEPSEAMSPMDNSSIKQFMSDVSGYNDAKLTNIGLFSFWWFPLLTGFVSFNSLILYKRVQSHLAFSQSSGATCNQPVWHLDLKLGTKTGRYLRVWPELLFSLQCMETEYKAQTSSRILSLGLKGFLVIHMSDCLFLLLSRLQSAHLHKRTDFDCSQCAL